MNRRAFITGLGALLALPLGAEAQSSKVSRIGFLSGQTPAGEAVILEALRQGLHEHGYVEGQNVVIEVRYAEAKVDRLPQLARELVGLKVNLLVVAGNLSALAARAATTEIPVVFWAVGDPVGQGFAASLGRPGGNMTGFMDYRAELTAKRLALLKEALPKVRRIAVLFNEASPANNASAFKEAETAARALSLGLRFLSVRDPSEFEGAVDMAKRDNADAVYLVPDPLFRSHRVRLAEAALRSRLPWVGWAKEFAGDGALLAYGIDFRDVARRTAGYAARILNGEKPGNLPIQQPANIELVVNLKTAKTLGLTIPPSLLLRADQVIE